MVKRLDENLYQEARGEVGRKVGWVIRLVVRRKVGQAVDRAVYWEIPSRLLEQLNG